MIGPEGFMKAPNTGESRDSEEPLTMRDACFEAAKEIGVSGFDANMCIGFEHDCPNCPWRDID